MDNFLANTYSKFRSLVHPARVREAGVPTSSDEQPDTKGGSFEERIVRVRDAEMALTVSAVYRATELRAKTIGQMPVQFQRKDAAGGNFTPWMTGLGRSINYLLQEQPNPLMTAPSLWEAVTIDRLMRGNGFVYIERNRFEEPVALWLAQCAGYNYINDTYIITYYTNHGIREEVNVPARDVLHFPNTFRRYNGFLGISTLQYASETLSLIKTEKAQAQEVAAKGGRVKGFISEEKPATAQGTMAYGMFNKEAGKKYAKEVNDNMWRQDINFLRGAEKFTSISMTNSDMQLLEQLNLGLDDVARFWAVPRPLLMLDTNSHYNDYQNATMEFMTRTVGPDKTDMEKEIARKLIGEEYYGQMRIHICEKPLLAMDPERQAKVYKSMLETGAMTVNEIRSELDMPAVEHGNIVYVSTNLAELGSKKLSDAPNGGRPANEEPKTDNDEETK